MWVNVPLSGELVGLIMSNTPNMPEKAKSTIKQSFTNTSFGMIIMVLLVMLRSRLLTRPIRCLPKYERGFGLTNWIPSTEVSTTIKMSESSPLSLTPYSLGLCLSLMLQILSYYVVCILLGSLTYPHTSQFIIIPIYLDIVVYISTSLVSHHHTHIHHLVQFLSQSVIISQQIVVYVVSYLCMHTHYMVQWSLYVVYYYQF